MFSCVDCGYQSDTFSGDVAGISQGAFTYCARCPVCDSGKVNASGPTNAIAITLRKNLGYAFWLGPPEKKPGLLNTIKLSIKRVVSQLNSSKQEREVNRNTSSVLTDEDRADGFSIKDDDRKVVLLRCSKPIAWFSTAISVETMRATVELIRACEETGQAQKQAWDK